MPPTRVQLRPHHLMCVHGFKGKGYSPEFVRNFWRVISDLSSDDTQVEVVGDTRESICAPCPNNQGQQCAEEPKIRKLDNAYVATLGLAPGAELSWGEAKKLIVKKVTDEAFERNCAPCSWKRLGYCKEALENLRRTVVVLVALFAFCLVAPGLARAQDEAPAHEATPEATSATAAPSGASSLPLTPPVAEEVGPKFTTVDQLELRLLLDKSRRVPALYKVQSALNSHDWKRALDAAKALESMPEYSDYYHYLAGEAELGRMRKFLHGGSYATANVAAEQARFHLTQVGGTNPYTTLWKRSNALLGEAEIALGNIQLKQKHRKAAQTSYESGFQRLAHVNLLATVPKTSIVSYALLCEKNRTDLCQSWVSKLAPFVTKTEEARIMERVAAFKRPYIERTPPVPYKIDMDLQAFQKGFQQYEEGKYEDAYGTWRDLLRDYPRTNIKLRTKFWMGRAAQKSKHDTQAETLYREIIRELPFSYYALLASWFGGIDLSRMMDAELPVATDQAPTLTPADVVHIRRAETLIASAVPELALLELQDVHPTLDMPNEFLVYLVALNHLAGNHQASFQMLSELSNRTFRGLFSSYGEKLYFPTARLPLIRETAKEWKVDPLLVISIVKQESAFNPEAASGASAYGLMQLIGRTARELDSRVDIADLFDPGINVKLGTAYMHHLLSRFHGSVILALAAYNAGPGNADRWLRQAAPNLPPEEFIETISFRETREYVQNILRNYFWYNRRIKGESLPSLAALTQYISPMRTSAQKSQAKR